MKWKSYRKTIAKLPKQIEKKQPLHYKENHNLDVSENVKKIKMHVLSFCETGSTQSIFLHQQEGP